MSVNYVDKSTGDLIRVAGGGNDILYADSPIGSIIPFGGTTAPDGFLLCNGDQVSKTTYSELYAVIGDSFKGAKANPTSGNFYLPDLREVTLKGVGTNYAYAINNHGSINNIGGFIEDRVQDHVHDTYLNGDLNYPFGTKGGGATGINYADVDRQVGVGWNVKANTIYTGRHGTTTEVKAVGVNYIIKAKTVALPLDIQADLASEVLSNTVDSVTDGESKPVSSNAVFDYLTPTEISVTLRSQLIDGGTLKAYRIGRMVFVNGSVHFTSVPTTNDWIFMGLPAPMSSTTITGVYALTNNVVQCTMATTGLVNGFEGSSGKTADWVAFNFSYVTAT